MNPRYVASCIVDEVTEGHSLTASLQTHLAEVSDARDRALIQAICYGVCRYYTKLDVILSHLLTKPMQAKDSDVHALLLVGLYQLIDMRMPAYAAVDATVSASAPFKKAWARGFINAILREYGRQEAHLQQIIAEDEEAHYAHPYWWIQAIKDAWPNDWESILTANNAHPPFALRVNPQKISREAYLSQCVDANVIAETPTGIVLQEACMPDTLPGFKEGHIFVQDGAAQLAAGLLQLAPNQRVLDACAAPGGKLTHIIETEPALAEVVAVDLDATRMRLIKDNLARLQMQATCHVADILDTERWWDGKAFDAILLDAPCSASGVIRRHPDIKLLRQASDIAPLAEMQLAILEALWPLLKPGGIFVYATCSIFPKENNEVIQAFLDTHPDAHHDPIDADWGRALSVGRQILPGEHGFDGFYYARLRRYD